jgi:hypothetical protein
MALIGRIIVIVFAVPVASIATGIAIAMGIFGPQWHSVSGEIGDRIVFWSAAFIGATWVGALGLLPLAILIAIAETFKIRSLLVHAVAGAALLLLVYYGGGLARSYEESIDRAPPPISRETEITAAAGIVFGLVYWAIAGRKAGRWRERV